MGPLNTLLIGHRGTGKTTLLKAFRGTVFDLDEEIAHSTGEPIAAILVRSESEFRNHERRVLADLCARPGQKVIAVGAGYEGEFPPGAHIVWVRRLTDASGRSFLNRPRLNKALSPFAEYRERFTERERRYRLAAHETLTLPEGGSLPEFLGLPEWNLRSDLTLLAENFRDWETFIKKRALWNLRRFELRDDLLQPVQIERAKRDIPREKLIYSCRASREMPAGLDCDYPFEWGAPARAPYILSLHERDRDLQSLLKDFTQAPAGIHKLSIEVRDFYELELGHLWWMEAPDKRAFLPRSSDGRWRWYRSLFGPRMPIHFIREGDGSGLDQPLLEQAVHQPPLREHFAAVLGSPVAHSRSPLEHRAFFNANPFVAVDVTEAEFEPALKILRTLGLKWAAVTAPLKRAAFAVCTSLTVEAESLRAVNTLFHDGQQWHGHNTDVVALGKLREALPAFKTVWLWGGGGIKSSVKRVWPHAREIAARTGVSETETGSPELIIWATGRTNDFRFPPPYIQPRLVLDLNYGDDSPGLEWAVRHGFSYQSGLEMFKLQAQAQRDFWRERKDV